MSSTLLDFSAVRQSALVDGMRVDDAFVYILDYDRGIVQGPLVVDSNLAFDINLPAGARVGIEALTCQNVGAACVTNYWGKLDTTLSRSEPVAVDIYPAGELLVNALKFIDGAALSGVAITLTPSRPRPGLGSFTLQSGAEAINLPVDTYSVSAAEVTDAGVALPLATTGTITVGQGALVEASLFFGVCRDLDGDGYACAEDCDETSARCSGATGCTADADTDGTPDCKDDCIDNDHDGFGRGTACLGSDCDDTRADARPGLPELCGDSVDNDCDGVRDETDCTPVGPGNCVDFVRDGAALQAIACTTAPL